MSIIKNASDLITVAVRGQRMTSSPAQFEGTLAELFERYIAPNLASSKAVAAFHQLLADYVRSSDPLLLIRYMSGAQRRSIYTTRDGTRFKATDNAPAWWIHCALFHNATFPNEYFSAVVAGIPAHLFDIARFPFTANAVGWHFAHIFDVKDRNTDYASWRRREVVGRFIRNVHPCNYFLVPKADWTRWGGDSRVIGYFATLYAERYAQVWPDFLELARADVTRLSRVQCPIPYAYCAKDRSRHVDVAYPSSLAGIDTGDKPVATYSATRLTFKASIIERLRDDDTFTVIIPDGTIKMTKRQFREVFPNVVKSASYREHGVYHYPVLPRAARQFLLPVELPHSLAD